MTGPLFLRAMLLAIVGSAGPVACRVLPPPPPPANVVSAPALKTAADSAQSKAAAAVAAAGVATATTVESPAKAATFGELSVAAANLPPPAPADARAALERVNQALAGNLEAANVAWSQARADATALATKVKDLEAQVNAERVTAAAELQRQLAAARAEAEQRASAREREIKTWIFFGVGSLLLLTAVASIFLKAYLPQLGANVTLCLGVAGALMIGAGILVRAVERLIEDHPFIFWGGLCGVGLALAAAAALIVANHHHHVEDTKPATQ